MLTHTVFFWLKSDLSSADRAQFEASIKTLLEIPGSLRAVVGKPAATEARPVLDHSYDYALELDFPDVSTHDIYQEHPMHLAFILTCKAFWTKVTVYDFDHL